MNIWKNSLFVIIAFGLLGTGVVSATPPKKKKLSNSNTSCVMSRAKLSSTDCIDYKFGVVGGENVSSVSSKGSTYQEVISGITAGVAMQVIYPKGFVLQPEILYSQKGCAFGGSGIQYTVDYVEVPVKFKYRLNITDVKPFVYASPYAAYVISTGKNNFEYAPDDQISDRISKFDYGVGVGAGADFWRLQLCFKYAWGFAQVIDEDFPIHNKTFTISLGIFF